MIFYEVNGAGEDTVTFGTLADAHQFGKTGTADEPIYRGDVRIAQVDVSTHKEGILRLVNNSGGTHAYTGRRWKLSRRGGLVEIGEDDKELVSDDTITLGAAA